MILFFIISFIIEDFYTLVNKSEHTWCIVLRTSVAALCFTFPAKSAILKTISNGYSYSAGCGSFNTEVLFMFRLWGKIWKDNRMLQDTVVCDDSDDTRTHKIFHGLEEICYQMDLGNPIWLDATVRDFKKHDKARFYQDNFIEHIEFDYLEIQVIEED